jgi:hypothetical protein
VRNTEGLSETSLGLQWFFEWAVENKIEYIKFLESDEIMTPECFEYMINKMTPEVSGVFTPVVKATDCCFKAFSNDLSTAGIGSLMLKYTTIVDLISERFVWPQSYQQACQSLIAHFAKYYLKMTLPQDFLCVSFKP